jgi:hypothetical protein
MTLKTAVREWIIKNIKPCGVVEKNPQIPIRNKPHIAVMDAPTWLYRAAFQASNGPPMDLNRLIGVYTDFIYSYMLDNNAHTFVLMFDCKTPVPKYINEKPNAIPTPQEANGDARAAWRSYFEKYDVNRNTDIDYMLNYIAKPTDKTPTSINYVLPEQWLNLLGNRDFKEYVSWLICNGVFHFARLPPGKKLVVLGPEYAKQRVGDKIVTLDDEFQFEMYEADFAMSCFLRQSPQENFVIFSIDGDVLVNLVYDRGSHSNSDKTFNTEVVVVTKFNTVGKVDEFVDINALWLGIHTYMTQLKDQNDIPVQVLYPVQTFCSIMMLCGNDYVENFPRIGPAKIFPAFIDTILRDKVTEFIYHANTDTAVKLNADAYFVLMMNCYKRAYSTIKYPQRKFNPAQDEGYFEKNDNSKRKTSVQLASAPKRTRVDSDHKSAEAEVIETIIPYLRKTSADAANSLTLPFVRNVVANLHWNLHYMIASSRGKTVTSGTEVSEKTGSPLYGFYSDYKKTPCGTYRVSRPTTTSLERMKNPF